MSSLSKHIAMKDNDQSMPNGSVPAYVRVCVWIVERLGFPVFVCGVVLFIAHTSMCRLADALDANSKALTEFRIDSISFQKMVTEQHHTMLEELRRVKLP